MARVNRQESYAPTEWEDKVIDEASGEIIVEGTPIDETNMNNVESGIQIAHLDIGLLTSFLMHQNNINRLEIEKIKNQRILQGSATLVSAKSNGYFRDSDPFVTIPISGFAQVNAPNYDVLLTATSADDEGRVGDLIAYDKTQNGFKVRMTGSAATVSFLWTIINPRV